MTLNEQRAVARLSATAPRRQYEHKSTWDRRNRRRSNFVARVRITPKGCWTWQGHAVIRNGQPYAVVSHRESTTSGKPVQRGAFSWMIDEFFPDIAHLFRGRTAPGCGQSLCLNPWHRVDRAVTRAGVSVGVVRAVYAERDSGKSAQQVARTNGVNVDWVQSVWAGRSWRSVTGAAAPAPQTRRYTDAERAAVAAKFGTGSLRQVAKEVGVHYKFVQSVWTDLRKRQSV